jgi:hypothetical protein
MSSDLALDYHYCASESSFVSSLLKSDLMFL